MNEPRMTLLTHGGLTGDATEPASNGYRLTVACPCGVCLLYTSDAADE